MEGSRPLVDDVAGDERARRRRDGAPTVDVVDSSLGVLRAEIEGRRARRAASGPDGGSPGGPIAERRAPARRPTPPRPGPADPHRQPTAGPRVLALAPHGADVRVFRIERPTGFTFRAGQHVKVGVPGGRREDFSLASAPHDPHLDLAVERREGGRVTPALFALRIGDAVDVGDGAKGRLRLDPAATEHLMIATVTGVAPLRSMVRDALHRGTSAHFTVLVGASHGVELPFHDELAALAASDRRVTYVPSVSRPDAPANRSWTGTTGRIDAVAREVARRFDPARTHVYAVGHAGMIANVRRDLGGAGFTVSTESYGG